MFPCVQSGRHAQAGEADNESATTNQGNVDMVKIKICGITKREDLEAAVEMGADFVGFNFYPKSPRYQKPEIVRQMTAGLPTTSPTISITAGSPAGVRRLKAMAISSRAITCPRPALR